MVTNERLEELRKAAEYSKKEFGDTPSACAILELVNEDKRLREIVKIRDSIIDELRVKLNILYLEKSIDVKERRAYIETRRENRAHLNRIKRLRKRNKCLADALKFYSDRDNYYYQVETSANEMPSGYTLPTVLMDNGLFASEALREEE